MKLPKPIKSSLTLSIAFCSFCSLHSQSNTVASGGEANGAGGTVSYSLGQIDYINANSISGFITEGVQQPIEIYTAGFNVIEPNIIASAYPNPSVYFITLDIQSSEFQHLKYAVYDVKGSILTTQFVSQPQTQISFVEFSAGIYFIKLFSNAQELKSFKVIKKS